MSTALYMRVSTTEQAEKGSSLKEQRERLEARCRYEGWAISHIFEDRGISGTTTDRPAFQEMMRAAERREFDRCLVVAIDRIARNAEDLLVTVRLLQSAGVVFTSLKENLDTRDLSGKLFLTVMGGIAEFENGRIKERLLAGKEQRAKSGKLTSGPPPYGYTVVKGELQPDADEARIVKLIFNLWLEGKGLHPIAMHLNKKGITTRRGKAWTHMQVKNVLRCRELLGEASWNGIVVKGAHPRLVTPGTFRKAAERFTPGSDSE